MVLVIPILGACNSGWKWPLCGSERCRAKVSTWLLPTDASTHPPHRDHHQNRDHQNRDIKMSSSSISSLPRDASTLISPSSSSESESLISHWPLENKKRQIDLGKKNGFSRHNYDSQVCEIQNSSLVGASLPWTWTKCTQALMHHVKWQQVEAMKNGD